VTWCYSVVVPGLGVDMAEGASFGYLFGQGRMILHRELTPLEQLVHRLDHRQRFVNRPTLDNRRHRCPTCTVSTCAVLSDDTC
jgi:hypothetical protein